MRDFLTEILARKREEVARLKESLPEEEMIRAATPLPEVRDLRTPLAEPGLLAIAEVKRASPSRGPIRPDLDPGELAREYVEHGAGAISVLTEQEYFRGSSSDLARVREAVSVPTLVKDFVIDPYQIPLARTWGGDAILLIVRALGLAELNALLGTCEEWDLLPLVEVHDEQELGRALEAEASTVGINNRDLRTFEVDLRTTFDLLDRLDQWNVKERPLIVSESGLDDPVLIRDLAQAGVNGVLIGESLLTAEDPGARLEELLGG